MTVDETLELLRAITGATDGTLEMWNSHPHVGSFKRANGRVLLANGNCVLVGEHGTGIVLHASIRSYPEPMPLAIAVGVLLGATTATPAARLGAETLARLDPTNSASKMTAHTSTTAAVTAGPQKQMAAAVPMSQVIGMSLPARVSLRMPMAGTSNIADYFRNQSKQERALEACGKFLSHRKWPIKDRLGLYKPALRAFKVDTAPADALRSFAQVWDDLCGWQVFRPAGPGWLPEKMFETMKTELAGFACDGPLTLFNFRSSESPQDLLGACPTKNCGTGS